MLPAKGTQASAAQLEAAKDSIRAGDEEEGLRRGPKRGSASVETAGESDGEDSNKRARRSASSTKTAEQAPAGRSTRGSKKKTSSSSKKKAKSPTAGKKWSKDEDKKLLEAVEEYGTGYWALFEQANLLPGRDNSQMNSRYKRLEAERAKQQHEKRIKLGKKVGYCR